MSMKNALIFFRVENLKGRMYWLYKGNECFWMVFLRWYGKLDWSSSWCWGDVHMIFKSLSLQLLHDIFHNAWDWQMNDLCNMTLSTIGRRGWTIKHLQLHLEIVDNQNNEVTTTMKMNWEKYNNICWSFVKNRIAPKETSEGVSM
jgi:hypothetical protein